MGWNAAHTSVGDQWGTGPTQALTPTATIHITTQFKKPVVYALDATGKRSHEIASGVQNGVLTFTINPEHKSRLVRDQGLNAFITITRTAEPLSSTTLNLKNDPGCREGKHLLWVRESVC